MAHLSEVQGAARARLIYPTWNAGLIAASIVVSLLGAFTSTQLMCQARVSRSTFATIVWTMMASLTFGFCSIWCLHFVAMLACELDLPIGLNIPLTVLSALLAVTFTFTALASDPMWEKYQKRKNRKVRGENQDQICEYSYPRTNSRSQSPSQPTNPIARESTEMLLERDHSMSFDQDFHSFSPLKLNYNIARLSKNKVSQETRESPLSPYTDAPEIRSEMQNSPVLQSAVQDRNQAQLHTRYSLDSGIDGTDSVHRSSTSGSRRGSGFTDSDTSVGFGRFTSLRHFQNKALSDLNPFKAMISVLYAGLTTRNLVKGFIWSLAVTLMHYLGIMSMRIPKGYVELHLGLVLLSAVISWIVCTVGCVLMASMETNLGRQLLFSVVASCGVAAMHYTGMMATSFYSTLAPVATNGYPESLPIAIASIAIVTCLVANGLLAHSATIARNKLAEIVRTRRKLWATIAQKENAEAAALAQSEFIASASHEIRTPLHQLQGYSDLMARCPLPEDARLLLFAIQDATKTLSLITNNVLDWSRLEKGEAVCSPVDLDIRAACDSIVKLLPRRDDDLEVELLVAVAPDVPTTMLLDETYIQRIVMNLVSNALKFTTAGHVLLMLETEGKRLVITVADTGVGIPASFVPDLFEPFKQAQTRGAERGTGLGLTIVKQLLEKIDGDIQSETKHRDVDGIGPERCGTKFIVRIPFDQSSYLQPGDSHVETRQRLALFESPCKRTIEGMTIAWQKFGIDVYPATSLSDIPTDTKYACVDLRRLQQDETLRISLMERHDLIVLVSYDTENMLFTVFGSVPPINFIPVRRPWILHNIIQEMRVAQLRPSKHDYQRTVRFASEVEVLSTGTSENNSEPSSDMYSQLSSPELSNLPEHEDVASSTVRILLVEDNKINQKLGVKMLAMLGYNDVIIANNGQEAIDILLLNWSTIDIILMDQSMPVKDGLTATKEIRELEENGTIGGASRWSNHEQRKNRRPIIAVTAVVGPTHEVMCKAVGTDTFLAKPLSLKKLRETLEEVTRPVGLT